MFHQLVRPVGDSLLWSFGLAALPIALVLILLGVYRRPAWLAASAGLALALGLAIGVWKMPLALAVSSIGAGAAFALWPVMWIVFNALILYNIAVASGRFDMLRRWLWQHVPRDRRVILVVVGFSFGCLLEGVSGFGTPVAITSSLLIAFGFPALDALVLTLIFNTAPVAFGALGVPVTTLGAVTQLSDHTLGAMIGRQLPIIAALLPFYAIFVYGGVRAFRGLFPFLLVAGGSFGVTQFVTSNFVGYTLTDVLSSLVSLVATVAFLKLRGIPHDPLYALDALPPIPGFAEDAPQGNSWGGWLPWLVLCVVVIVWTHLEFAKIAQQQIPWPGLHNRVFITVYDKPYAALWNFQPLATGTAILLSTIITGVAVRCGLTGFFAAVRAAFHQAWLPALTTVIIIGLAYLMNYSGMTFTLGVGVASTGVLFPLVSAFLGWLAVFLTGSDTSGNALFGNLQVVAAHQLGLSPVLMAATNSSGGVMGKMISPQNICTGAAVTDLKGREGEILGLVFKHSLMLAAILGVIVMGQQYLVPWMIPH